MIEVFKTNVEHDHHANMLVAEIHKNFDGYQANFDLDDCDKILRVKTLSGIVAPAPIIKLLNLFGFQAEVLAGDDISPNFTSQLRLAGY